MNMPWAFTRHRRWRRRREMTAKLGIFKILPLAEGKFGALENE
jgi:hypothetical protein